MTTEVIISFDTEDFSCARAAEPIKQTALLLKDEGVRACYNMVGLLAKQLIAWGRFDVLDALKYHEIDFHSLDHSIHPTLVEYTDIEDYDAAHDMIVRKESEGMGMVRAATGVTDFKAAVPPCSNASYVVQYFYAESGIKVYSGGYAYMPKGDNLWMFDMLQTEYNATLEWYLFRDEFNVESFMDMVAQRKRFVICNHPNRITHDEYWDMVNYNRENKHPWGEWEEAKRHTDYEILRFYERLRLLVQRMKAARNEDGSPRFKFVTYGDIIESVSRERVVSRSDMAVYRDALKKAVTEDNFHPLIFTGIGVEPISLSECLYSAAKFATTDDESVDLADSPLLKGFLYMPQGVESNVTVTRDALLDAAKSIDFEKFLPTSFNCNGTSIGPLDLLMGLLDVLVDGASEATITPKPQQPNLDEFPVLRDFFIGGTGLYTPEFKDKYISERYRLQAWTMHN